jgi:ABC-type transport system substrate-binding protein
VLFLAVATHPATEVSAQDEPAKPDANAEKKDADDQKEPEPTETDEAVNELPTLEQMVLPSEEQLLNQPPVDWIVLKQGERVLVTEPVFPRPDTIVKMRDAIQQKVKRNRPRNREEREAWAVDREDMSKIDIVIPKQTPAAEYRLHIDSIDRIVYHEDLILQRTVKLMKDGRMRDAYELFNHLVRRHPEWPGIGAIQEQLLFAEAESKLSSGRPEQALAYLEDLHGRNPKYSGLNDKMGSVIDDLVSQAAKEADYRRGRHFLGRLQALEPQHTVVQKWKQQFLDQANAILNEARTASEQGQHDVATQTIRTAIEVWPTTPGLREAYQRMSNRFQQLKVGVLDLPQTKQQGRFPIPTEADKRSRYLTQTRLFELERTGEISQYRTRFLEQWEPTDLGRKVSFTLRQGRSYWEPQPIVAAPRISATLLDHLDPASPRYDERLDSYIASTTVRSPFEFELEFARVPVRLEALLGFAPRTAPGDAVEGEPAAPSTRFRVDQQDDQRVTYRRVTPERDGAPAYHVAEIVELKHASHDGAMRSLMRGRVSFLPHVQSWNVPFLVESDDFFVQQYTYPVTHVIQLNPRSKPLASRELRRALAYALNREPVLKEIVLRDSQAVRGRVVTAPFPQDSYAYNTLIEPRSYDPYLALVLRAAAVKKHLGGEVPRLKMLCVPDPVARAAAEQLVTQWAQVGIEVELVSESAETASDTWDMLYRTIRMAEPVVELWPFLAAEEAARIDSLRHLPDLLRSELVELDETADWNAAVAKLKQLHLLLWEEVQYIPLWEVDDFMVLRRNLRGFPTEPVRAYQGIEEWTVPPWYSQGAP